MNLYKSNFYFSLKFGFLLFCIGIFFLASAPIISLIFIIFASIIGSLEKRENYFQDKYNYLFIFLSLLLISSCIFQSFYNRYSEIWDSSSAWIGLSNWIPFFWIFWAIQPYLSSTKSRNRVSLMLISGTFPVIFSGFTQYFLKLNGPYETLNGLIIWYQRGIDSGSGLTGLFNNQNYTGAWLSMILPFSIFFCLKNKNYLYKFLSFLITFLITYMIFLTNSRGAILSILLSLKILNTSQILIILIIFALLISILLGVNLLPIFPKQIKEYIEIIFPKKILDKIPILSSIDFNSYPRFEIWRKSIKFIKSNPIIGYGAGSFPIIYKINNGIYAEHQHAHNLFLQVAHNYGIPSSLILLIILILILSKTSSNIAEEKIPYENIISYKAWSTALLIFFTLHMFDITYFDGRINMLFWILLSANRCIIRKQYLGLSGIT